jgi:2-oxoglutarate ferredoxin oxidoreductase subunit delta
MSGEKKERPEGPPQIEVVRSWCKSCGICVEFCPKDVLAMEDGYPVVVDRDGCNRCQLCDFRCPDFAIYVR